MLKAQEYLKIKKEIKVDAYEKQNARSKFLLHDITHCLQVTLVTQYIATICSIFMLFCKIWSEKVTNPKPQVKFNTIYYVLTWTQPPFQWIN